MDYLTLYSLITAVAVIPGFWTLFEKAGQPGWKSLIPFYNYIVFIEIAGKPGWWILLTLIPVVNIIFLILIFNGISKKYGRGAGFTVGLIFIPVIFVNILGFSSAQYEGEHFDLSFGAGPILFTATFILILIFFWWLLMSSHGIAPAH